ncbi:class I SAM-dependent methyltransferase [Planococcus shenhongbingii]|uniref:Class I SAM-dependent methyltransferase n=1 Tax=Planococcus shenhongbingii TaxID=3058398 RepID=A0ABT8NGX6_9BACL|nr:class I SAM-dependent methyltransferase [Planococcus sp. N017]MDN7247134.1 class I SAM-dependent methyltransferase [Planococcus sp. N017]
MHNHHSNSQETNHKGKMSFLDSPKRREELSPEKLLSMIPIKETDTILDFGAGTGYLAIPAAKMVKGTVYALDIDAGMLEMIRSKALQKNIDNIVPVQVGTAALPLSDASIDVVLASLVLHEISPLEPALKQITNVLKKGGYLVCVELESKGHSTHKAPRISSAGMEQEIMEAGLHITQKFFPAESLYVLIAQKQ